METAVDNIPGELKAFDQWVVWKLVPRPDKPKPAKVPYVARAKGERLASTTDPDTWSSFGAALTIYALRGYDGLGFVFTEADPFVFVDLDGCIAQDRTIAEWARRIVDYCKGSYCEYSPGGYGLHLIMRGALPEGVYGRRRAGIEIYSAKRFATVTGHILEAHR